MPFAFTTPHCRVTSSLIGNILSHETNILSLEPSDFHATRLLRIVDFTCAVGLHAVYTYEQTSTSRHELTRATRNDFNPKHHHETLYVVSSLLWLTRDKEVHRSCHR